MATRRVRMTIGEYITHEFVTDVEIDEEFVDAVDADKNALLSYLNEGWDLFSDNLRWEHASINEQEIEAVEIVEQSTPVTFDDEKRYRVFGLLMVGGRDVWMPVAVNVTRSDASRLASFLSFETRLDEIEDEDD